MKQFLLVVLPVFLFLSSAAQDKNKQAIRQILSQQQKAWNKGNIAGYMKGYWENDSLIFIGKNGPTYGYYPTLERYQKAYPDKQSMGDLKLTVVSLKKLSNEYYFVIGKWALERTIGNLSGSFTLLFRKIERKWVIINDHSS